MAANGNAILIGNNGVDVIKGAAGTGNNFIFGETARFVRDDDKVKLAEAYPDVASVGQVVIYSMPEISQKRRTICLAMVVE